MRDIFLSMKEVVILAVGLGGCEGVLMRKSDAGRSLKRAENNRQRPLPTEQRKVSRSVNKPPAVGGWRSVYPSLCSHHFISSSLIFFSPVRVFMSALQLSVFMRIEHEILKSEVLSCFQEEFLVLLSFFFFTALVICKSCRFFLFFLL